MKHGLGMGSVSLFVLLQAIGVGACGEEGGEPGPGTGACCTGTQCTVVSASACSSMDGTYKGNDVSCGTNTCGTSGQTGACFGSGNACTMTTRAQCPPPSEYAGEGTMCPAS
ncbi:MAG: hypothetical protein H0T46_01915 [Deltaproteobacteria bacterium]|nr:hypothetical protein [Deltaproteobacteria bacterium]